MAQESCNLDKDEAEILKPKPTSPSPSSSSSSSSSPPPPPPATTPSSLFLKPNNPQELPVQKPERLEEDPPAEPDVAGSFTQKKPNTGQSLPPVRFGNRCSSCRKRVGLTGFRCRCGDLFCPRHRYSDTHDCSFDYKAAGRDEISKANPVIRPAKIIKI